MEINELQEAICLFVSTLDTLKIPYYIGGSVASSVFGLPRSTMDVDIIADINKIQVKHLTKKLSDEYYIDGEVILKALERKAKRGLETMGHQPGAWMGNQTSL